MSIHLKTNRLLLMILSAYLSIILISCILPNKVNTYNRNNLIIHYIDVGQGDSILIQINNKNMLIDAGPSSSKNKLTKYLKKQGVKRLNYVIITHPHEDHIGGIKKVIENFDIKYFYAPKVTSNTETFTDMINALRKKSLGIHVAKAGLILNLDKNIQCEMLAPNNTYYKDMNNYSAVIKITFKKISFLFTGDAQKLSEDEIINAGYDLSSNVLKVGHHGSRSSTSDEFIKRVNPNISIISCGMNNDFGHPHKPTLSKLQSINSKIYRTDKDGTIVLISNGLKISKK